MLSGKAAGRISARTEEAVRAAAQELGYRPNVAARALRTGVARSVALVVPDITNPFFGRVLRGAQRAAQQAGYTVVLVDLGNDRAWEEASLRALLAGPADGLLLFEADLPPGRHRARDPDRDVPGPAAGRPARRRAGRRPRARPPASSSATPGSPTSRRVSTRRPSTSGATGCASGSGTRRRRSRRRSRSKARPRRSARCSTQGGFTAIFCDDDILAGGVYLAARERGIDIPGDLSVVGFDDLDFARVLAPPLTTVVAVDAEGLGAAAFSALAREIAGETVEREQVMPVRLEVRESTALAG